MAFNHSDNHRNKTKSSEKLTVDAIHPLFNAYRNQNNVPELPGDSSKYFCKECQVYFPKFDIAIMEHFQNRTHCPIQSCIYCEGPVCEYYLNSQRQYFHNCEDKTTSKIAQSHVPQVSTKRS